MYVGIGRSVKVYSEFTNEVESFVDTPIDEWTRGLAWDEKNQQLYYCTGRSIHRVHGDGSSVKVVFSGDGRELILHSMHVSHRPL